MATCLVFLGAAMHCMVPVLVFLGVALVKNSCSSAVAPVLAFLIAVLVKNRCSSAVAPVLVFLGAAFVGAFVGHSGIQANN